MVKEIDSLIRTPPLREPQPDAAGSLTDGDELRNRRLSPSRRSTYCSIRLRTPQGFPSAADSDLRLRILEHGIDVISARSILLYEIHKNAYFRIFGPYHHSVLCPIVLPSFHNISIGQPLLCGILAGHIYLSSFFCYTN